MQSTLSTAFLAFAGLVGLVAADETHIVRFNNHCNYGTPKLILNGTLLSNGEDYVSDGPLVSAIAFLQTNYCSSEGNNCAAIETTLQNGNSDTYISIDPPYAFSVPTSFMYYNGCDDTGASCAGPDCADNERVVRCTEDNVSLNITFCPGE